MDDEIFSLLDVSFDEEINHSLRLIDLVKNRQFFIGVFINVKCLYINRIYKIIIYITCIPIGNTSKYAYKSIKITRSQSDERVRSRVHT